MMKLYGQMMPKKSPAELSWQPVTQFNYCLGNRKRFAKKTTPKDLGPFQKSATPSEKISTTGPRAFNPHAGRGNNQVIVITLASA